MSGGRCFRVLSIEGGGMRGIYSAAYLSILARRYTEKRKTHDLDIGKGFDLITGTSTGAILSCALAADISLDRVVELYRKSGPDIFPQKLPKRFGPNLVWQMLTRPRYLRSGAVALESALVAEFADTTLADIWERRMIALAIPAVEMSHHRAFIFKTPHLPGILHRDRKYKLVDVCLATTAAPIYRSMARIGNLDTPGDLVFVDGGLWANNPVLVGLIEALKMTKKGDRIEIYSLGTCPRPGGELVGCHELDRGLFGWQLGGRVVSLSLDAQESVFYDMARMLGQHVERDCKIVRFPRSTVPGDFMQYLALDETKREAMDALIARAKADVDKTESICSDGANEEGQILHNLLNDIPNRVTGDLHISTQNQPTIGKNAMESGPS